MLTPTLSLKRLKAHAPLKIWDKSHLPMPSALRVKSQFTFK